MPTVETTSILDATTVAIGHEFREQVVSPHSWVRAENQAGSYGDRAEGESGGFFVTCDQVPRRAYLKPLRVDPSPNRARAAREKIAADLAWDVGVCVPPVTLYHRPDAGEEEEHTCLSLVLFPMQFSWANVKGLLDSPDPDSILTPRLREVISPQASVAHVFDTWICQGDHDDHPHNIVFGFNLTAPENSGFAFLDYAMALGYDGVWSGNGFASIGQAPFPGRMIAALDAAIVEETISRIEQLQDARIREVVDRIPDEFLASGQRDVIRTGLIYRRSRLRTWITMGRAS